MSRIAAVCVLALAGPLTAQESDVVGYQVQIRTVDGNEVRGTASITAIRLDSSLGKIDVEMDKLASITLDAGKASLKLRDGSVFTGTLDIASWKVKSSVGEFDIKTENIRSLTVGLAVRSGAADPKPGAEKTKPPVEPVLKPLAKLAVAASAGRGSFLSQDGSAIYFLNAQEGKLLRIRTDTLEVSSELAIPGGGLAISPSPSMRYAFVICKTQVAQIDLAENCVLKFFPVEQEMRHVVALDDDLALVSFPSRELGIVSASRQSVLRKISSASDALATSPDRKRIYAPDGTLTLAGKVDVPALDIVRRTARASGLDSLVFTPDSRFALSSSGTLHRAGRSAVADLVEVGKIEPFTAATVVPATGHALLFTEAEFIKTWDLHSLQLLKSTQLGLRVSVALSAPAEKVVYLFGGSLSRSGSGSRGTMPTGDWYKFAVPE